MNLQDAVKTIFGWGEQSGERQNFHVMQVIDQAFEATKVFGNVLPLLDRYFFTISAL